MNTNVHFEKVIVELCTELYTHVSKERYIAPFLPIMIDGEFPIGYTSFAYSSILILYMKNYFMIITQNEPTNFDYITIIELIIDRIKSGERCSCIDFTIDEHACEYLNNTFITSKNKTRKIYKSEIIRPDYNPSDENQMFLYYTCKINDILTKLYDDYKKKPYKLKNRFLAYNKYILRAQILCGKINFEDKLSILFSTSKFEIILESQITNESLNHLYKYLQTIDRIDTYVNLYYGIFHENN